MHIITAGMKEFVEKSTCNVQSCGFGHAKLQARQIDKRN